MTPYDLASRFRGQVKERPGAEQHPLIQWMHSLCSLGYDQPDEVPWCSSFVNMVAWLLRLPRSKSAAARSWLEVGIPIPLERAEVGWDVVIFARGEGPQPGPDVIRAPGHVGFYAGREGDLILVLGGNQGNDVTLRHYSSLKLLGVRRLTGVV